MPVIDLAAAVLQCKLSQLLHFNGENSRWATFSLGSEESNYIPFMVWDLGRAMRKKEEVESGRLMDFEFRQRVRSTRLFSRKLGVDEGSLVGEIALRSDDDLLDLVAEQTSRARDDVATVYAKCLGEARQHMIAEKGVPTPNRLG